MLIIARLNYCFNTFFALENLPPTPLLVSPVWYFPVPLPIRSAITATCWYHPKAHTLNHLFFILSTQFPGSFYSLWLLISGLIFDSLPLTLSPATTTKGRLSFLLHLNPTFPPGQRPSTALIKLST